MLLLGNVSVVLEAAEGRLFLCKSFGQTVHGLVCGAHVQGVAWVSSGVIVSGNSSWSKRGGPGRAALTILSLEDGFLR